MADGTNWSENGCGMWFMWIIVIFALMGGGNFGWGNRGNALTQAEMQNGFNHQDTMGQLRGITYGIADSTYATNTSLLKGQAEIERGVLQSGNSIEQALMNSQNGLQSTFMNGINSLDKTVMQTGFGINQGINNNRFSNQQGFCETNRNIDNVKAENFKNTCDLKTAIHTEGEMTRAMIANNQIQELRDKLADRDRELQTANFNLSQVAQSSSIVSKLRPYPMPAYITASPYQSNSGYLV